MIIELIGERGYVDDPVFGTGTVFDFKVGDRPDVHIFLTDGQVNALGPVYSRIRAFKSAAEFINPQYTGA